MNKISLKKYGRNNNYVKRKNYVFLMLLIIFFLTVGYSSIGTVLSLRGQVFVKTDKIAPTVEYSVLGGLYNTEQSIEITPIDNESGVDYYNVYVYKDGVLLDSYENLETEKHEVILNENGTYEVRTFVVDIFGNVINMEPVIDEMYYQTYLIDKEKPTVIADIIYTDSTSGTVTITVEDNIGGSGLSSENNYQYCVSSINSTDGCVWLDYSSSESFELTGNNEVKYLFVYPIKDNANNISGDNEDVTVPYLIGIYYFDSILPTLTVTTSINNNSVDIRLNAEDTGGSGLSNENIYQYCLSSSSDSITDCTWTNYISGETFTLSSEGTKYLFVYPIKDNYGNVNDNKTYGEPYMIKTLYEIYKITYDLDGGTISSENPTVYTTETETFTLINPTKSGYVFAGWTGSNGTTPNKTVSVNKGSTGDKTYTANWTVATYTITYNCNGGSGSTASSTHTYGVAKNLTSNGCYKITAGTGGMVYYMSGWSTSSTATSATYTNGQSVTDVGESGTVTLYAVWEKLFNFNNTYTVINDGSGNWRVKFLKSGTYTSTASVKIDVFCVGGGGNGGGGDKTWGGSGGAGGKTKTTKGVTVSGDNSYTITVGGAASTSSAFGVSAAGGASGTTRGNGGSGGSGGGGGSREGDGYNGSGGDGGTNGSAGKDGESDGGSGQGTTTREFGESSGTLYAGGGGGGAGDGYGGDPGDSTAGKGANDGYNGNPGVANTGGGGGGGGRAWGSSSSTSGGAGGSGIVVIRNAR